MNYKQSVKKIQAGIEEKLAHQFGEKAETLREIAKMMCHRNK